jgi:hypothetical protein
MTQGSWDYEELWVPWELVPPDDSRRYGPVVDTPDELLARFTAARAEMEAVWQEIRKLEREIEDA